VADTIRTASIRACSLREHPVPLPDKLLGKPAIKRLVLLKASEIGPLNF
jgi:hypothetical protein